MHLLQECLFSFCASLCFGIVFQLRGGKLLWAAAGGCLGWLVFRSLSIVFASSEIPRYFFATVAITLFSEIFARFFRAPVTVFLAVGLIPLVPGGGIYRTMLYCISGTTEQALSACINTIGIAGSLAMGVVIVSSIVRLLSKR